MKKKTGQKFLYLSKLSSTKFNLESNSNFLKGKNRPEILISSQLPSTKFYLESNWKFLNERGRPEIPISPQTRANEIRFRIKLKLSEWKNPPKVPYILAYSPQRNSIQNQIQTFWMKKSRPEVFISSQTSLNEILFGIKLKISEWKRQAGSSYISASSLQRNSI